MQLLPVVCCRPQRDPSPCHSTSPVSLASLVTHTSNHVTCRDLQQTATHVKNLQSKCFKGERFPITETSVLVKGASASLTCSKPPATCTLEGLVVCVTGCGLVRGGGNGQHGSNGQHAPCTFPRRVDHHSINAPPVVRLCQVGLPGSPSARNSNHDSRSII